MSTTTDPAIPLILIIRFATSIPDLRLPIPSPSTTNAATLCTLIRPHLPPSLSTCPLRLIYAGALLPARTPLSTSLRLSSLPPPPSKQPHQPHQQQLYIHCSLPPTPFTPLSPTALAQEAQTASSLLSPTSPSSSSQSPPSPTSPPPQPPTQPHPQTVPQPLGFDRLLTAGLQPAEIALLRSQFLAIQSHTHTPDTMPSTTAEIRAMEERWLDNGAGGGGGTAAVDGGGGALDDGGGEESEAAGSDLEDMLWGNVMGFFWAVGAVVWLVREEGVWSKRRVVGVVTGFLLNVVVCVCRGGM